MVGGMEQEILASPHAFCWFNFLVFFGLIGLGWLEMSKANKNVFSKQNKWQYF